MYWKSPYEVTLSILEKESEPTFISMPNQSKNNIYYLLLRSLTI